MRAPLDPFSGVVDEKRHWDPEWYSWLTELATTTTKGETTDAQLKAQILVLQAQIAALQAVPPQPPPGMVFISRKTVTSPVPDMVFTGMDLTYDTYVFEGANLMVSVESSIAFQTSNDNGASFFTSGIYYTNIIYDFNAAAASDSHAFGTLHNGQPFSYLTHGIPVGAPYSGQFTLKLRGAGVGQLYGQGIVESGHYHGANGAMTWYSFNMIAAGGHNALRFVLPSGGSFTAGSITMYGMRKT